jgi:hypothetical protein
MKPDRRGHTGLGFALSALFFRASQRAPGLLFLAQMLGNALGQIGFEPATAVDAGRHDAGEAAVRRPSSARLAASLSASTRADFLLRGLSFAQALAGAKWRDEQFAPYE